MHDPGTAGQNSQIVAKHNDRLIFGDYYTYDAKGSYTGNVGISDGTIGQQIIGSVYNVHFGNWGGLPVKLAYLLFGTGLCVIVASGLKIYFIKRHEKGNPAPRLEGAWTAIIWGTPAALALTLLVALFDVVPAMGLVAVFWLSLVSTIAYGGRVGRMEIKSRLLLANAMLLASTLTIYFARYQEAVISYAGLPVSISLIILAIVSLLLWRAGQKGVATDEFMVPDE